MSASCDLAVLDEPDAACRSAVQRQSRSRWQIKVDPLVAVAIGCCVVVLVIMAWPMFVGQVHIGDDLGAFHLPLRAFYAKQLAAGQPFDWCPDLFGGFYLTGEGQAGTYHPLHWLLYRCLPLGVAFDLECWLNYPLILVGTYLFLRRWRLARHAALLGAMVFMLGSFNLLHFAHIDAISVMAHLPWLLMAIDVLLRDPNSSPPFSERFRRGRVGSKCLAFVAIALLTGSQLLIGHPQYMLYSGLAEAGYLLLLALASHDSWRRSLAASSYWFAAVAIGGLIGGMQLIPTFDALAHSVRQSAAGQLAAQGSLHPLNWLQLFAPYLLSTRVVGQNTHELGLYMGAAPLVLAVWWIIGGSARNTVQRQLTIVALAIAVTAMAWACGVFGPLGWLQAHLPLINRFRLPCRAIVLFQLAFAALAALGFSTLPRQSADERATGVAAARKLWWLVAISVTIAVFGCALWPEQTAAWPLVLAGPMLMIMAVWLLVRAVNGSRPAVVCIVLLTAIDLGAYGLSYSLIGKTVSLATYIQRIDVPPGATPARVALDLKNGVETAPGQTGPRQGDQILLAGWKRVDGYAGLEPARQLDYRQPAALRAAGVVWISPDAANAIQNAGLFSSFAKSGDWSELENPRPRAWLVARVLASDQPRVDIAKIDLTDEALIERPLEGDKSLQPVPSESGNRAPPGKVRLVSDRPGSIELATDSAARQLLVVNESFDGGWRPRIDGQMANAIRANGDFLGVAVPAGNHEIQWKFRPLSLQIGRILSGIGLSLIGAMLVWSIWPRQTRTVATY